MTMKPTLLCETCKTRPATGMDDATDKPVCATCCPYGSMSPLDLRQVALRRAFDLVRNPSHWKAPIDWRWSESDYAKELRRQHTSEAEILQAIIHFTATEGRVERADGFVYIKAPGYWAGPAN